MLNKKQKRNDERERYEEWHEEETYKCEGNQSKLNLWNLEHSTTSTNFRNKIVQKQKQTHSEAIWRILSFLQISKV